MAVDRSLLASLVIKLGLDSASFARDVNKVQGNMNVLKVGFKELMKGFAAAFSVVKLVEFGAESYKLYKQQEKDEQLLLTALKGRKDIQERLIAQAKYVQATTLFSDEDVISQQKYLAALGMTEKQIKDIIKAAAEFSTAKGIDLGSSVSMLAKSYGGSLRGIGMLIPELKKFTKEQLAAGAATEYINETMHGLAETAANNDPFHKLSNAAEEFKEKMGKLFAINIDSTLNQWAEWLLIRSQEDLTAKEKWAIDLFKKARHDMYLELQDEMKLEMNEEVQKWAKIFEETTKELKNSANVGFLSKEDQENLKKIFNPLGKESKFGDKPIETLTILQTKLKDLKDEREELNLADEQGLADNAKEITQLEDRIKKYEELGKKLFDVSQNLKDMKKSVESGNFSAPYQFQPDLWNLKPMKGKGAQVSESYDAQGNKAPVTISMEHTKQWHELYDNAYKDFMDFAQKMEDANKQLVETIRSSMVDIATSFSESIGEMIGSGKSANWGMLLEPIANVLSQFGKLAITAGVTMIAIKASFKSMNPYVMIVAGGMMVALAAAVKARIQNLGAGTSSAGSVSQVSNSQSDPTFRRNLGDLAPIRITGDVRIEGEALRVVLHRAESKHQQGA